MRLPVLLSVPHAGTETPDEVLGITRVSREDVIRDGDEGAADVFLPLRRTVAHLVTTDIARAFVDLNRAPDDIRKDGVIKTHTCWDVPIYSVAPDAGLISELLDRYYYPYHAKLSEAARGGEMRVGIDCHTMAAVGPPVGPDPGSPRPAACVSDAGVTCDRAWTEELASALEETLGGKIRINDPFLGGYTAREHAAELPWLQLEISRGNFANAKIKADAVRAALEIWTRRVLDPAR